MNEAESTALMASEPTQPTVATKSGAGAMLRAAREAQGLHIAMLSVSLKVPVRKLEALEADRFDLLPDMVFARSLAASVCRALRIDMAPVLAALPPSVQPLIRIDDAGLNATYDDGSSASGRHWSSHFRKPLSVAAAVVMLAILIVYFLPEELLHRPLTNASQDESVAPLGFKSSSLERSALPAASASASTAVATSSGQVQAEAKPVDAPASALPIAQALSPADTVLPATQLSQPQTSAVDSSSILVLKARGSSWAEVKDAKGTVLLRRVLSNGEMVPVSGALPMSVVLGRSEFVAVLVRGQTFDTSSWTNDNVARFEVK